MIAKRKRERGELSDGQALHSSRQLHVFYASGALLVEVLRLPLSGSLRMTPGRAAAAPYK